MRLAQRSITVFPNRIPTVVERWQKERVKPSRRPLFAQMTYLHEGTQSVAVAIGSGRDPDEIVALALP